MTKIDQSESLLLKLYLQANKQVIHHHHYDHLELEKKETISIWNHRFDDEIPTKKIEIDPDSYHLYVFSITIFVNQKKK